MAVLKAKDVDRSLCKKGFVRVEGDHHYYHFYDSQGNKTSTGTKMSHSATDIGEPLIKLMAKQTKLSKNEFMDLINCPLSKENYEKILREKGEL